MRKQTPRSINDNINIGNCCHGIVGKNNVKAISECWLY